VNRVNPENHIVLIGFMGAGKSSVAKGLSKELSCLLVELDDEIVALSGLASVKDIFAEFGEKRFRALEAQALNATLKAGGPRIISTGGGVLSTPSNRELLKASKATTILLNASFQTIATRLDGDSERPLFKDVENAKQLYVERQSLYQDAADFQLETDDLAIEEVIEKIISLQI